MLIMINGDNKMNMKLDKVRITCIRIILDLHGVIILLIQGRLFSLKVARKPMRSLPPSYIIHSLK